MVLTCISTRFLVFFFFVFFFKETIVSMSIKKYPGDTPYDGYFSKWGGALNS